MPNTETYIVDDQGGIITQPDQIGELVVRGANVMKGYWNLPEETAKKLRPGQIPGEQVLFTGDLFKMDDEGFLYFISRKDEMLKTVGELVSPKEIEDVLYDLDGIQEAGVIGVPDEILGQAVKAIVVLEEGVDLTEEDIIRHCAGILEKNAVPSIVEIRTELPKTSSGKVDRGTLKKESARGNK
jgi:acyl-CoA synthetase (AMP-forming)/AMP-acid ligase II